MSPGVARARSAASAAAENQHRTISSASRDGPAISHTVAPTPSTSALDNYSIEDDVEEDTQAGNAGIEDAQKLFQEDFHQELKRPLSRKKDPSACLRRSSEAYRRFRAEKNEAANSGGELGSSASISRRPTLEDSDDGNGSGGCGSKDPHTCSREWRKLQRWQPASNASNVGRPASKAGGEQAPLGSNFVGGTWAAARAEPRVLSETRRGRERKAPGRGSPEVGYATDLGVFGMGTRAPNQQLTKSLSGVFDHHSSQFRDPTSAPSRTAPSRTAVQTGAWADAPGALEVSGCGLGDHTAGSWLANAAQPCGGSPPSRKGGRHSLAEAVSVEEMEAPDPDHALNTNFLRNSTPAQVIVTRSTQPGQSRGMVRRNTDARAVRERERNVAFSTSLDVDFLSLFAS
eukprot:CAMPEP_0115072552 /NCGR_PEP_ID=MMETSP0227-20121206/14293_1 /TAXON_ID=89957 /ORGANISM="Polarella glacialis, Strain CCMP 1383" /LENGTH=401 /DNA_ID=CAMNT_0002459311 /DNA_START=78 /DNA_END=1283 /DNA_ORIENTATION=+